jgi:tRNA-dihydrouridine synthase A
MKAAVAIPITVKCRIGIDQQDPQAALDHFTDAIKRAGADALIVHARKAWLKGLSPKENREVPPLDYDRVYRLKSAHPELAIVVNGGIGSLEEARAHLDRVDGVMIGRAAYQQPWRLLAVDDVVFGEAPPLTSVRAAAVALIPYIERELGEGTRLHAITRHLHGLFQGVPGARAFRRRLAAAGGSSQAGAMLLREALALVSDGKLDEARAAA